MCGVCGFQGETKRKEVKYGGDGDDGDDVNGSVCNQVRGLRRIRRAKKAIKRETMVRPTMKMKSPQIVVSTFSLFKMSSPAASFVDEKKFISNGFGEKRKRGHGQPVHTCPTREERGEREEMRVAPVIGSTLYWESADGVHV